VVAIVDKIHAAKRKNRSSSEFEAELDERVAGLYGLTREEILIINDHGYENA
jgi:hypothetical protein